MRAGGGKSKLPPPGPIAFAHLQRGLERGPAATYCGPMTDGDIPDEQALAALRSRMAEHLGAALACLDDIEDPVERERAARLLADDLLPGAVRKVRQVRSGAVIELRVGRSLREVGELLGLSIPRVDQLARGK